MFIDVKLTEKINNGFTRLAAIDVVDCFRFIINSMVAQRQLNKDEWKAITAAVVDEMYYPTSDEDKAAMEKEFNDDLKARKASNYGEDVEPSEPGDDEPEEESPKYTTILEAIAGKSSSGEGSNS